jgi:hypothetical protein
MLEKEEVARGRKRKAKADKKSCKRKKEADLEQVPAEIAMIQDATAELANNEHVRMNNPKASKSRVLALPFWPKNNMVNAGNDNDVNVDADANDDEEDAEGEEGINKEGEDKENTNKVVAEKVRLISCRLCLASSHLIASLLAASQVDSGPSQRAAPACSRWKHA